MKFKVFCVETKDDLEKILNKYCAKEEWIIQDILTNTLCENIVRYTIILFKP